MALPRPFKEDGPEQCYCLLAVRCRPSRDSAYKPQLLNRKESRSEEPNRRRPLANLKTLVHEQFGPYGKGGQFEPHAVGPVRFNRTGSHTIQPKLLGYLRVGFSYLTAMSIITTG